MAGQNYGLQRRLPMTQREYDFGMAKIKARPIPSGAYSSPMVRGARRMSAKREMMDAYYGKPGVEDVNNSWAPMSFYSKMKDYKRNLAVAMQRRFSRVNRPRGRYR